MQTPISVTEELQRLVAFPTISTNPVTAIAAHLAQRAEDAGFIVERFDDPTQDGKTNLVASIGPPEAAGGLVISGHMDVVPVAGQPWTSDPFVVTERDGALIGRGTADMKGFIAATVAAVARIQPADFKRPLVLIWTHDEEVGCHGSAHLATRLNAERRSLPRDCWIGEPTDFQIFRMHAGHVAARVTTRGSAAHSAFPELGANAIEAAAQAVTTLGDLGRQLRTERHPQPDLERDFVPLNVGTIVGGAAVNIVPDLCTIELGFRPLPGHSHEATLERIERALRGLSLPAGTSLDLELIRVTPSLRTDADTPLTATLLEYAATPSLGAAGYATDGGNLARCGCAPLVFGPGSIKVAHQADEFVDGAALLRCVDIVEKTVRARCC